MVFIDLEKGYERIPRDLLWWILKKKNVSTNYIDVIKDMHDNIATNVRIIRSVLVSFLLA